VVATIGTFLVGQATYCHMQTKTTDDFLHEYNDDSYRQSLKALYAFRMQAEKAVDEEALAKDDKMVPDADLREKLIQDKMWNIFCPDGKQKDDNIEKHKRKIWIFAVRLHYAEKYCLLRNRNDTEIWGTSFYRALAGIVKPLSRGDECTVRHAEIFTHAEDVEKKKSEVGNFLETASSGRYLLVSLVKFQESGAAYIQ